MKTAELMMSLAGAALQLCLCALLIIRASYREFRFFTLCMLCAGVSTVSLILLRNHPTAYFYLYWPSEALTMIAAFFSLQESFYLVFRNFLSMSWFRLLFPGIGILMLFVTLLRAAFHPVVQAGVLFSALVSLEIAVGFLQVGIFCLFLVLVRFFHMRSRQQAVGVVLGFGVAACGTLIVYLLRSEFGTKFDPILRITPPLAYIAGVVIWLATFLRAGNSGPTQEPPALTPEEMVSEVRRYTRVVKGFLGR